jgi:hypothetical protein
LNAALTIADQLLREQGYEFSVSVILDDFTQPIIWVVILWMTMTVVRTLRAKQSQSERYWGI